MKILNGEKKASKVIFDHFCVHRLDLSDNIKHFFAMNILHDQINILFVMKSFDKANYIRENYLLENSFLSCY